MRIKETKVYPYSELSKTAKERAHGDFITSGFVYPWGDDNAETLKAFCDIFPIDVGDWEYGYRNYINSSMRTAYADTETAYYDFRGIRLLKWIVSNYWRYLFKRKYIGHLKGREKFTPVYSRCQWENSCVLTGYCIDDDILGPLYEFIRRPDKTSSFEDILKDCLESWIVACNKVYEYCYSEEYFAEHADANDFEFTVDGKLA